MKHEAGHEPVVEVDDAVGGDRDAQVEHSAAVARAVQQLHVEEAVRVRVRIRC